jgi:hypothetical protein
LKDERFKSSKAPRREGSRISKALNNQNLKPRKIKRFKSSTDSKSSNGSKSSMCSKSSKGSKAPRVQKLERFKKLEIFKNA